MEDYFKNNPSPIYLQGLEQFNERQLFYIHSMRVSEKTINFDV